MQAQLILYSPREVWTNLDIVAGEVSLTLPTATDIASITVKLEGDMRTVLAAAARPELGERSPRTMEESHKLLYNVVTVFPPNASSSSIISSRHYKLNAGHYQYPFSFKIPFNNKCYAATHESNNNMAGFRLEPFRPPLQHVKGLLPPTLTSFPGLAEIQYYLKVTVNRREFYKENVRCLQNINLLPIEPPRPAPTGQELYARRTHEFPTSSSNALQPRRPGFLDSLRRNPSQKPMASFNGLGTKISLDARLPNPAILTCNQDLPLRIFVTRLDASPEPLALLSVNIELIGNTRIRAHDVIRNEYTRWIIVNDLNTPAGERRLLQSNRETSKGALLPPNEMQLVVNANIWRGRPLPPTVAPSFGSCAIGRSYELVIKIGIGYGQTPTQNATVIDLHIPVAVYSGIVPPAALISRMSTTPNSHLHTSHASASYNSPAAASPVLASSPFGQSSSAWQPPLPLPPRPVAAPLPQDEEEPPPRYEDAIAADLPPVEGPRSTYSPPVIPTSQARSDNKYSSG